MSPIIVYSPQLKESFEVTEIRGNAIYTTKGAVLSKNLISDDVPVVDDKEFAKRFYRSSMLDI